MKLKKIASLMLAGIMAVSMLAGCKTGTTPNDDSSSSTPATSGIVSAISSAIKDYYPDLTVSVKDNPALNNALNDLFEKNSYEELKANSNKVIDSKLDAMFGTDVNQDMSWLSTKVNPSTANAGTRYNWAFIEPGKVSGTTAQVKAANEVAKLFDDVKNTFKDDSGNVYNASFTLYAAQLTATDADNTSVPVVVVVLETKTAEKI